ncbi:MAG: hypothetical protein B6V02_02065 [Thermoprotei archaeon ex4572_64]|nr:MAG: hypothetical protein B6V02_02065 [Thermoprotei archaeon ex4572_64]
MPKPRIQFLSIEEIKLIHEEALHILENVGVEVLNNSVVEILKREDCRVEKNLVKIPKDLVEKCLNYVPREVIIHDRDGKPYMRLSDDNSYFNPGSAASKILDPEDDKLREPILKDLKTLALLVNSLENIKALSTALIPHDVPIHIRDRVRLYPLLKYSSKPIVTGAFTVDGVYDMVKMLSIVTDVSKKPCAIFDVCPSPPLKWSYIASQNIVDLALHEVPIEIISMPQINATGPATIAGSLIIHHAEVLSGITIAQCVKRGVPVIYGGSPSLFDVRYGTTAITAPEATLLTLAYVDIAKYFKLPTHAYVGLSDSKMIDYQAGLETLMTALLASLKGVNICSGPGMLEFENVFSFEKLIIDNEACGIAYRLARGFEINEETLAIDIIKRVGSGGHFLAQKHTIKWCRIEHYLPEIIDRMDRTTWSKRGSLDILKRSKVKFQELLKRCEIHELPSDVEKELINFTKELCSRYGCRVEV